ncbi:MAG: DUF1330 domain-containing protein [Alphaproteobacteria bacterium]
MAIDPTAEQAEQLMALDQSQPVIFINCHRYFDRARYGDDYDDPALQPDVDGKTAYHRYLSRVESRFMPQVGGRFLIAGPVAVSLIGDKSWDEIVIGEYPSIAEANRMSALPGYDEIVVHRVAGLAEVQTTALLQKDMERLPIPGAWINRD